MNDARAVAITTARQVVLAMLCVGGEAAAGEYQPPRLHDGHVDLQGIWNLSNLTPLERPRDFDTLIISPTQATQIESWIDSLKRGQPTGGEPDGFDDERYVERIHGELHSSVIVDPRDGIIPGNDLFKRKAAQFRKRFLAADGPEERPPPERCLSSPGTTPPMQAIVSLNLHEIIQTPDIVVIHSEWNRDARIIRMNAKHAPSTIVSWLGDSIGWWDKDTLVVETTYFTPTGHTRTSPLVLFFVSPQTVVTERFTRASNEELIYGFTVVDPTYYTAAWTGENHLNRAAGPILEYACHEGNYSLAGILRGARVQDAQDAAPLRPPTSDCAKRSPSARSRQEQ
jgi:hypothetical protein